MRFIDLIRAVEGITLSGDSAEANDWEILVQYPDGTEVRTLDTINQYGNTIIIKADDDLEQTT